MLTVPNLLTLSRIVTVPLLAWLLWWPQWPLGYALGFGVYCLMGITDYLREFLGGIQVSLPVSRLAKWKTTLQMVALGSLILIPAVPGWAVPFTGGWITPALVGITTLWAAAVLTAITGWDYLRVGVKHMD